MYHSLDLTLNLEVMKSYIKRKFLFFYLPLKFFFLIHKKVVVVWLFLLMLNPPKKMIGYEVSTNTEIIST